MSTFINIIDKVLSLPFFYAGVLYDRITRQQNPSSLFFFFPHFHTGGAERVHSDIIKVFRGQKPWVVITKKSRNKHFYESMRESSNMLEIYRWINNTNKFFVKHYLYGYFSSLINRHENPFILGSNSTTFFYELLPYLKKGFKADIMHGFYGIAHRRWLKATRYIDQRICISDYCLTATISMYRKNKISNLYDDRLRVIHNSIPIPENIPIKSETGNMKVMFVGRNSKEKRYYLYEKLAKLSRESNLNYDFFSIGDFESSDNISSFGEITDGESIYTILKDFHILILCSCSEGGLPLVILEAMACGLVTFSTIADGAAEVISSKNIGRLIRVTGEDEIVSEFVGLLSEYNNDYLALQVIREKAYHFVKENFSFDLFSSNYRKLVKNRLGE